MKQILLGVIVLAACTKAGPPPAKLDIQPAKLVVDGKPILEVTASGDVLDGKRNTVGKLSEDGTYREKGNVVSRMDGNGRVTFEGEPEVLEITADGTGSVAGELVIKIADDGIVETSAREVIRYQGAPSARRAMVLAWSSAIDPEI